MRRRHSGFSIIELLVVVGIIALLLTILLPSISKARDMSKRTACASNLRTIGIAARAFATEHGGSFPVCFATPPQAGSDPAAPPPVTMKRMPLIVSMDPNLMSDEVVWKRQGIPMSEWTRYGAPESIWHCFSSPYEDFKYYNIPGFHQTGDDWGPIVWTDYMWVAGLVNKSVVLGNSRAWWGILEPAVSLHDRLPETRILAADAAFYAGNGAWASRQFHINHPAEDNGTKVGYQNVLYADGHVEANNMRLFPKALNADTSRHSLKFDNKNGQNGFFYWGPEVAYTPGRDVPPPAPPPPPNPNPAPPNPNPPPPPPPPPPSNTNPLP